jgi:hypothetical protein
MSKSLLKAACLIVILQACGTSSNNRLQNVESIPIDSLNAQQPLIDSAHKLRSLMELPQTQYGGFVLSPGFYETEFKTYCLQPGTPDPRSGDAYYQGPITGYRKDIIESVLLNSRTAPHIDQRNIQLLLWSAVSGSDFNKLSPGVKADAMKLLTPKQIFELKGGIAGAVRTVASSGIFNTSSDIQRLFEAGASSYESYERIAVLREPSQVRRTDVKFDQWYKQKENYYIRYFPVNYQKVRIQVYVPDGPFDSDGKVNGEYLVFDPTGQQAIPAFTNAQPLGIGVPVKEIVRVIIWVGKRSAPVKKTPPPKKDERIDPKKVG